MKVALLKDINNFGKKGDVKDVKDGYGRNFLLRNRLAEILTPAIENKLQSEKETREKAVSAAIKQSELLKEKIKNLKLTFKIKTGESGRIFGSVTPLKIVNELKKHGLNLEKEQILTKPIKIVGENKVKIILNHNTEAFLNVLVKPENGKDG